MPQGVAFRASGDFAVTLNENGTMTRLTFPTLNFSGVPTLSSFASGGFRGGLLRVGADGCIYAPQGRMAGGTSGVRFGDNAVASSDSIVRVCGGFAPSPGVANAAWSPEPGSISGSTFVDCNRNGVRDAAEPGLSGVQISLSGADTGSARHGWQRQLYVDQRSERAVFSERTGICRRACRAIRLRWRLISVRVSNALASTSRMRNRRSLCARRPLRQALRHESISRCETAVACGGSSCGQSPTSRSQCVEAQRLPARRRWTSPTPVAGDVSVTATRGNAALRQRRLNSTWWMRSETR